MKSLEGRVVKLEQGSGAGACQCKPRCLVVLWPDGSQTGAATCATCGLPATKIVVRYEDPIEGVGNEQQAHE
jgi:hypothetical protein